ncbi:MAG: DUF962 domain-containing protein [Chitinophagales bacterium]|nr:DUF962 domain-containing protein [Chitinophagales bacterium]
MTNKRFQSISEFYPYYLSEHRKPLTRMMHFVGTLLLIICLMYALLLQKWLLLFLIPVLGYGFAWASHAFIERNKPATFTYPVYSLGSDFIMFWDMLTGRISKRMVEAEKQYPLDQH